jgi:hypothetical protein
VIAARAGGQASDPAEVPLDRLWHAVPAYPTVSEVWLRLLDATLGELDRDG